MTTPTGQDPMKEAAPDVLRTLTTAVRFARMGIQPTEDEAAGFLLALFDLKTLVEAQPAAVAGEADTPPLDFKTTMRWATALADMTADRDEWRQQHENLLAVRQQDLAALTTRAAPAAPLVGEPQQPVLAVEVVDCGSGMRRLDFIEPRGQNWWSSLATGRHSLYASPAAPAGVPTADCMECGAALPDYPALCPRCPSTGAAADQNNAEHSRLYALAQAVIDASTNDYTKCGDYYRVPPKAWLDLHEEVLHLQRRLLAELPNSFHLPACDSSEASGSAIPARPTLPGEELLLQSMRFAAEVWEDNLSKDDRKGAAFNLKHSIKEFLEGRTA